MKRDLSKAITYRPSEVSALYGVSISSVQKWCQSGSLPSVKIGGKSGRRGTRLIRREAVEKFMSGGAAA